jgi:hypothetical protein
VALAAMSISAASGGYGQIVECRATAGEGQAVRGVVAAVVASLARDLLGTEPSGPGSAFAAAGPAYGVWLETSVSVAAPASEHVAGFRSTLAERLLDLPPPAC